MHVLGIDTATFTASAALVDGDGKIIAEDSLDVSARNDDLLVLLDRLCRSAGLSPPNIDAVAVGGGPGSFTGLRIAMATAKGIAFAAGCPLWIVSSLAAMAAEADEFLARGPAPQSRGLRVSVLDARRGEVFVGCYLDSARKLGAEQVIAPEALGATVAAALATLAQPVPVHFCGDALAVHVALAGHRGTWMSEARTPSAAWIARLALRGDRHDELSHGRPAYLRPAEAEVKYPDGVPGALRIHALPALASESTQPLPIKRP